MNTADFSTVKEAKAQAYPRYQHDIMTITQGWYCKRCKRTFSNWGDVCSFLCWPLQNSPGPYIPLTGQIHKFLVQVQLPANAILRGDSTEHAIQKALLRMCIRHAVTKFFRKVDLFQTAPAAPMVEVIDEV